MPLRKALKSLARPAILEAQCTHTTMTRVYGPTHLCSACHRPGPFGWVYQCTQDKEGIIDDALAQGDLNCCDQVGLAMVGQINARRSSVPECQDKFSFLDQISFEEMANYRPDQIATILRQKEKGSTARKECLYRVCAHCRPTCADRAYISLDAVAKGHMPPTAITGFSFQTIAGRPVTDARIVKSMGQRPVPAVGAPTLVFVFVMTPLTPIIQCTPDHSPRLSWLNSSMCLMDLLERQIACGGDLLAARDSLVEQASCSVTEPTPTCAGTLTRSPPCNNLEDYSQLLPEDKAPPRCVAPEPAFQCENSPLFDVSPALGMHARNGTDSSYTNLRLGAGSGFERGISDLITAV
ncbi:hypothetical protein LLEC1_07797 [Akanthomyces lecanii]|uniref:Uncharacterized protein n=1 Tax=Cordyceps confragosa TaxID=2714763 RepID=A0A179IBC6_CORDF|nr:hypothetical protein LLEC1_07797 [Akanthomyces lecanii]